MVGLLDANVGAATTKVREIRAHTETKTTNIRGGAGGGGGTITTTTKTRGKRGRCHKVMH